MKTTFIFLLAICNACCFGQMKPDRYDTFYVDGYVVAVDTLPMVFVTIKPIIKMLITVEKQTPCSTLYVWNGDSKDSLGLYSTISHYDSTKSYGPCGYNEIYVGFPSKYKGDTIINQNCESWESSTFKELFFIPNKKKKHKLGNQYELKRQEFFGEMDTWNKPPFIICG